MAWLVNWLLALDDSDGALLDDPMLANAEDECGGAEEAGELTAEDESIASLDVAWLPCVPPPPQA